MIKGQMRNHSCSTCTAVQWLLQVASPSPQGSPPAGWLCRAGVEGVLMGCDATQHLQAANCHWHCVQHIEWHRSSCLHSKGCPGAIWFGCAWGCGGTGCWAGDWGHWVLLGLRSCLSDKRDVESVSCCQVVIWTCLAMCATVMSVPCNTVAWN